MTRQERVANRGEVMNRDKQNVGTPERIGRVAAGAAVAAAGLWGLFSGPSLWLGALSVAGIVLGLDFVYTGVTGYCPLYAKLGWATSQRSVAVGSTTATTDSTGRPLARERLTIAIDDLACAGGDAQAAERTIAHVAGVLEVYVNPATENAYVDYDPAQVTPETLREKVREFGFSRRERAQV